jgi:hypothetical protein
MEKMIEEKMKRQQDQQARYVERLMEDLALEQQGK